VKPIGKSVSPKRTVCFGTQTTSWTTPDTFSHSLAFNFVFGATNHWHHHVHVHVSQRNFQKNMKFSLIKIENKIDKGKPILIVGNKRQDKQILNITILILFICSRPLRHMKPYDATSCVYDVALTLNPNEFLGLAVNNGGRCC
jgi:hypothetical protein